MVILLVTPSDLLYSSVKRRKKWENNKCIRHGYVCVHACETKFLWNTGPDHRVLKKMPTSKSSVASSCGYRPPKHETFWEERFSCCFCFTAVKNMTFKNKIFYYGFANRAIAKFTLLTVPGFLFGGEQKCRKFPNWFIYCLF